jgi:hypothetical protein
MVDRLVSTGSLACAAPQGWAWLPVPLPITTNELGGTDSRRVEDCEPLTISGAAIRLAGGRWSNFGSATGCRMLLSCADQAPAAGVADWLGEGPCRLCKAVPPSWLGRLDAIVGFGR